MNNDLEQFSEERLKKMIFLEGSGCVVYQANEVAALARIALSAKQAKPANSPCEKCKGSGFMDSGGTQPWGEPISVECDCTITRLAHTEPDGWASSRTANDALVMLDRIETTDPVDDDRIEGIKRIIRQLTTPPVNSPVIPDGWKLVPTEATRDMIWAGKENLSIAGWESFQMAYQAMLAAAPKPESE